MTRGLFEELSLYSANFNYFVGDLSWGLRPRLYAHIRSADSYEFVIRSERYN